MKITKIQKQKLKELQDSFAQKIQQLKERQKDILKRYEEEKSQILQDTLLEKIKSGKYDE
jgi:hypothetical protein